MFATIRRHQSWLLATIVAITIVSFVAFGPNGCNKVNGNARGGGGGEYGSLGGRPITLDQLRAAARQVLLEYGLRQNQWPDYTMPEVQRSVDYQAYLNLFLEDKMKELGIEVTPQATARYYQRFFGPNLPVAELERKVLMPNKMSVEDLDRLLRFYVGKEQLMQMAGLNGFVVTPQEAEKEYRNDHLEVATSAIFYSATNFMSSVPTNAAAVAQFYTNHLAEYKVPERVLIDYVKFNVTNYLASAEKAMTNIEAIVDLDVKENGTNLFVGAKTPAESRAAFKTRRLKEYGILEARRDAFAFANELSGIQPVSADNLRTLATKKGMQVISPAPFDRENGPQDMTTPMQFIKPAFSRTADDPVAPPITTEDGAYVLVAKLLLPSSIPPLNTIEAKVATDYRHIQALMLTEQAATKLYNTYLTNALPLGIKFPAYCDEAKVKLEPLPPFSRSTRSLPDKVEDRVDLKALQYVGFDLAPGQPSQPMRGKDGAFILYVDRILPLNEVTVKAELPEYTAKVRQYRLNNAFNEWMSAQVRRDTRFVEMLMKMQSDQQVKSARPAKS